MNPTSSSNDGITQRTTATSTSSTCSSPSVTDGCAQHNHDVEDGVLPLLQAEHEETHRFQKTKGLDHDNHTCFSSRRKQQVLHVMLSLLLTILFMVWTMLCKGHSLALAMEYPIQDSTLLQMADQDLARFYHRLNDDSSKQHNKPKYRLPPTPELTKALKTDEVAVLHIDTTRGGKGLAFVNGEEMDHLRLLWWGCSLERVVTKLRAANIEMDTYIVLTFGDGAITTGGLQLHDALPVFPVWNKARQPLDNHREEDGSIMVPYELLMWSYPNKPPTDYVTTFDQKTNAVVYRGKCTNARRKEMVEVVRDTFPPPRSNVHVPCLEDKTAATKLTPKAQSKYRCILDYDGIGYSRRMAWYMQTGSVILRGGHVDDILSRLARIRAAQAAGTTTTSSNGMATVAPPVIFWKWDDNKYNKSANNNNNTHTTPTLTSSIQSCLTDETYARSIASAGLKFGEQYVNRGQQVWEGYLMHLVVEQSLLMDVELDEEKWREHRQNLISNKQETTPSYVPPFYKISQSQLVCTAVQTAFSPTGANGAPKWKFILQFAVFSAMSLVVIYKLVGYLLLVVITKRRHRVPFPATWRRSIWIMTLSFFILVVFYRARRFDSKYWNVPK